MGQTLAKVKGYKLVKENNNFYMVFLPNGDTWVNLVGTKDELICELIRWKEEIDIDNDFMLEVENKFLEILEA